MNKDRSIQIRISLGYLLVVLAAVFAVWYILKLTNEVNKPKELILNENNRSFQLGALISDFYISESSSRVALSTLDTTDINRYEKKVDSLRISIENLKLITPETEIVSDLDSISNLLLLKKDAIKKLIDKRVQFEKTNHIKTVVSEIKKPKENVSIKKIDTITNYNVKKKGFFSRLSNVFNSKNEEENIKEIIQKNNEIIRLQIENKNEIESYKTKSNNALEKALKNDRRNLENYLKEEEKIIQENVIFSHKIRNLVESVEKATNNKWKNIFNSTNLKIEKVTKNIIYFGLVTLLIIIILSFIIIKDINNNYKYKIDLEKNNEDLEEIMRQKNFFMASITHDMNAPLNTLFGYTQLLENSLKNEKLKNYTKNIHNSAAYFKNLIDDLSLFSRLEQNFVELNNYDFEIQELIDKSYEFHLNIANKKNIELKYTIDPTLNKKYVGDPHKITQILTNVISNAIKFTDKGNVSVDFRKYDNGIKITIVDTGIGVSLNNKEDIYKEFVQAKPDISRNYGGTGLGLNITKRIIDLMKGSIDYESEIGKGTTFYIYIPLEDSYNIVNNILDKDLNKNKKLLINKNILVIDDDVLQLQLLKEILIDKVKSIDLLSSGEYLKKHLDDKEYHLIISDLQMPNFSGYQIIEEIRKHDLYKQTPVIAFSGKIDINIKKLKEIGFDTVLKKPINLKILLTTIKQQLNIEYISEEIVENNNKVSSEIRPYSLKDLEDMFDNDTETIKNLLKVFIDNMHIDLQIMYDSFQINDLEKVSKIAHKILPMYRQIHIESQIECLESLERNIYGLEENERNTMLINFFTISDYILKLIQKKELD